ncbi:ABC transporter permease subunit [Paenibacillus sp. FA6]|uniref:ABC transporter permease subunit n=1 Tax=Paenibacillus sp. FA6 TaxID=3413029 RepID=UPI003F65A1BC
MNIFLREMKAYRKSLIIWCIGVFALIASGMSKFETISASGQSLNEMMSKMPKSLQTIMGMGSLDLSKVSGYFGFLFLYVVLMATIHAVMLGSGIISKEEQDKTTEFLMAKPVSRNAVITSKLLSAVVNIAIFNGITTISTFGYLGLYSKGESIGRDIVILMTGMFMLQLIFLLVGTVTASAGRRPKSASSISGAVLLATYVLATAADLNDKLEFLQYVTPFSYYKADRLLSDGGLSPVFVIISVVIIAVLIGVTYAFYNKRDLNM